MHYKEELFVDVIGYLLSLSETKQLDVFRLMSLLYLVDRHNFIANGCFITKDRYYVTDSGFIPMNMMKFMTDKESSFHNYFAMVGTNIKLVDCNRNYFVSSSRDVFNSVYSKFADCDELLIHMKRFPEYKIGNIVSRIVLDDITERSPKNGAFQFSFSFGL